jgi:hypothetical protein
MPAKIAKITESLNPADLVIQLGEHQAAIVKPHTDRGCNIPLFGNFFLDFTAHFCVRDVF